MIPKKSKTILKIAILLCCIFFLLPVQFKTRADAGQDKEGVALSFDATGKDGYYSAILYDNTNGLPASEANDICQTEEGFIWIGSYSGLVRYDGHNFEKVNLGAGIASVIDLFVDRQNRLWIGTSDDGLVLMENDEFRRWDVEDGLGTGKVQDIAEDSNGIIYAATTKGISMIYPDMTLHNIEDPQIKNLYIEQLRAGKDGILYGITNEDDYFMIRDGELLDFIDHTENSIKGIVSIYPDPDHPGEIYFGTDNYGVYHCNLFDHTAKPEYTDISPLFDVFDFEKFGDQVWVTTINGVGFIDNDGFHCVENLPMRESIESLMEDYEGNLWFTSTKQGVMKIVSNPFQDVFNNYGLEECVVNSTCLYKNRLYIATNTGIIVLDKNGVVSNVPLSAVKSASGEEMEYDNLTEMLNGCRVRSVIEDSKGYLWISTWRSFGLLRFDGKEVISFTEKDGLQSNHIRSVVETKDGKILVVHTGGISVIEGNKVVTSYNENDGFEITEVLCAEVAPNGDILVGSNGGGIYIVSDEGVRSISKDEGFLSSIVMRIKYDADRKVFWVVTGNSIAWMTEDYEVHTVDSFPNLNNFDLFKNNNDEMFVLGSDGIYVLPVDQLLRNENVHPVHYGIANGLSCISTSNSYSHLTEDGDLYLSGNRGVVKFNINSPLGEITNLKLAVPYVDADGERIYPNEDGEFILDQDVLKVTIYGYIFNYSLTDPFVTYTLEGFDKEKVTVPRSELGPVIYTNLPGGSYRFVLEIKDLEGQESKSIEVPIIKKKRFYEMVWSRVLITILDFAVLVGAVLFFLYLSTKKMEKRHTEEMKKQRLRTELRTASDIQISSLPQIVPPFSNRAEFEIYATMDPARDVGGDFYDFFFIDEDHLCLVIADVSGKGIPAALFMMSSMTIIQNTMKLSKSVTETLRLVNEELCLQEIADMFVTVWMGVLEISSGIIRTANAGHEYPALYHDGKFTLIKGKHDLAVAVMPGIKYHDYEITLEPGDKIFVYTDGVPEATDAREEMFGMDRMVDALNIEPDASPKQVMANVRKAVDDFVKDAEQVDDLTMLCIEYKGNDIQKKGEKE